MRASEDLSKEEIQKMFYNLSLAISSTKGVVEASDLLQDLLSFPEAEMIAKRLQIAGELVNGAHYRDIQEKLKVSPGTIARVSEWLLRSGDGYRRAVSATRDVDIEVTMDKIPVENVSEMKRRFPMYYWPQILLETMLVNATKKQQREIKSVLRNLEKSEQKTELYEKIRRLMS